MGRFSFSGVVGRQKFIISYLLSIVAMFMWFVLAAASFETGQNVIGWFSLVAMFASIIYSFQMMVQRMRDIGLSMWFIIISAIPYVNTAYLIYLMVAKKDSQKEKDTDG